METFVARKNIERYRRLLEEETDETARNVLLRLIAEEEARLRELNSTKSGNAQPNE